jgi:hypothetical protein
VGTYERSPVVYGSSVVCCAALMGRLADNKTPTSSLNKLVVGVLSVLTVADLLLLQSGHRSVVQRLWWRPLLRVGVAEQGIRDVYVKILGSSFSKAHPRWPIAVQLLNPMALRQPLPPSSPSSWRRELFNL